MNRIIDGKRFYMIYPDKTSSWSKPMHKKEAQRLANNEREEGRLVRVIPITGGYGVFVRNK